MSQPAEVRLALDWTPNTIHSGLFLASHQKYYSQASPSLRVSFLPPSPSYDTTPARLVAEGKADLCICPSESIIAYAESGKVSLQAIYAICQRDASAIATEGPKFADLKALGNGGRYGSYNARYEDAIVRQMVTHAGGKGDGVVIDGAKGKLSLFEELKKDAIDATWIFVPWEGLQAELDGIKLNVFRPEDHGVPYGYSPLIARDTKGGKLSDEVLRSFTQATAKGYQYAIDHPEEAADIMAKYVTTGEDKHFLERSQKSMNAAYVDGQGAGPGRMEQRKWSEWLSWLREHQLLQSDSIRSENLFTNEFLA